MREPRITKISFFFLLWAGMMASCHYDVEEELYPDTGCLTDNISYSSDVLSIIQENCYVCHDERSNNGNVTLEGYDNLVIYVNNGRLQGAITHAPGFSPMPNGQPKLLECDIEKILAWIDDGAPNN